MAVQPAVSALVITQHYRPELIGSGPYLGDIAEWMAGQGLSVRVLTCRPHYPTGEVAELYADGRLDRERCGGVEIERVTPWLPHKRDAMGRIIAEGIFLLRGLSAVATGRVRRSDMVVSLCPSILTVALGALLTRRGGRHVAVVHDIPSGLASGLKMVTSGILVHSMRWVEKFVLNRTDAVLVLSESMRRRLLDQGVTTPIQIVPVWVDTELVTPRPRVARGPITIMYSGNFGKKQALSQIVQMASLLSERDLEFEVVLQGAGSEARALADEVARCGISNVRFSPLVPMEQLGDALAAADIHVIPQDSNAADFAVPSKIVAVMAAGRPFVATARPGSLLWQLQKRSGGFLCVPAGDHVAFADAVERLARDPSLRAELGNAGRKYVLTHHDKFGVLGRFFEILNWGPSKLNRNARPAAASSDL